MKGYSVELKLGEIYKKGLSKFFNEKIEDANIKIKLLISWATKKPKEYIIMHPEYELTNIERIKIQEGIKAILKGKPLQYIINNQEFMGLEFYVDENVLIPQPDTEILVEKAEEFAKNIIDMTDITKDDGRPDSIRDNTKNAIKILDLCTGSGCIGISLKKELEEYKQSKPQHYKYCKDENGNQYENESKNEKRGTKEKEEIKIILTFSDISEKALEVAKRNAQEILAPNFHEGAMDEIKFIQSDLFETISQNEKFDLIVSNPPYIKRAIINTLSKEVQDEPHIALDGGDDGLDFYRRIIKEGFNYVNTNGRIFMEIGYDQKEDIKEIIGKINKESNLNICSNFYKDLSQNDRVVELYLEEQK